MLRAYTNKHPQSSALRRRLKAPTSLPALAIRKPGFGATTRTVVLEHVFHTQLVRQNACKIYAIDLYNRAKWIFGQVFDVASISWVSGATNAQASGRGSCEIVAVRTYHGRGEVKFVITDDAITTWSEATSHRVISSKHAFKVMSVSVPWLVVSCDDRNWFIGRQGGFQFGSPPARALVRA